MRRIPVLFIVLGLVSISFLSSRAQTRGMGAGALILDDYNGHVVTLQAPLYQSPEWYAWQATSPPFKQLQWSVPVPPLNNAQAGFLYSGPLSDSVVPPRIYLPYWLAPHIASIRAGGDGNTGGFAGSWDYASIGELGIVGGHGTLNYIPKWNISSGTAGKDTTIGNSSITDDGDTIRTAETINLQCLTESGSNLHSDYAFMNFLDANGVTRGSIQGQDYTDLTSDPAYQANEASFIITTVLSGVQILTGIAQGIYSIASASATAVCAAGLFTIPAIPLGVAVTLNEVTLLIQTIAATGSLIASIVAYVIANEEQIANLGVQYSSQGADYAEYLKRENPNDRFYPGDIIGVRNGLISKNTEGAQSVLTISTAPLVLGNAPSKDEEANYEKVGFLGQVPVKVRGIVHQGDFVMADGLNDGIGVAVSEDKITPQQLTTVLGRAWTTSDVEGISLVKVAIGLSAKDMSEVASREQAEIDSIKSKSDADNALMNAKLDKLTLALAEPDQKKRMALLTQVQQPAQSSQSSITNSGTTPAQSTQLSQSTGTAKSGTAQKTPTLAEVMANTEQLTLNSANKMISSGQLNTGVIDQMRQMKSYVAVKQLLHSNIQKILQSTDSPKVKGAKVKQYLSHPDAATSQAFGACVMEAYPIMKSAANAMAGTPAVNAAR